MSALSAEFERSYPRPNDLPAKTLPEIACIGRSNVGKSSFINHLCETSNLSRVSATPGRTQLINRFKINSSFFLVDLPGYGYAKHSKERRSALEELIFQYVSQRKPALVLLMIDAQVGPTELDDEMREFLKAESISYCIIVNKVDKLSKNEQRQLMKDLAKLHTVPIFFHSMKQKTGRGEILQKIISYATHIL